MQAALKAVEEGESISKAARDHGIPKTTLFDHTSGRVAHGTKPGPRPYLNSEEEKELATYLKHCAKVGYGRTRRDVLGLVQTAASDKGVLRSSRISQGWWHRFLERQKDLSLRQGDSTAHVRMDAMNKETIDHYFGLLHDTLSTNGLLDKPAQIYNVDESGVPFNPRPPKVVSPKGRQTKKVRYRCSTTRKAKCARTDRNCEADFNDSECCVCFVPYEEDQSGKDWVACGCGRWLHEDCADDCIIDSDGNERLCLICLNRSGK